MTLEASIVTAIVRVLDRRGAWSVKIHGSGVGRNGIPDLLCCYRGCFVAIECKTARGKPTPLQVHELARIAVAGGTAIVARSAQDAEAILDEIDARLDRAERKAA